MVQWWEKVWINEFKGSLSNQSWFLSVEEFQIFRLMPNIHIIAWSKSNNDLKLVGFLIVSKPNYGHMKWKWWNGLEPKLILWIDNDYKINKINLA